MLSSTALKGQLTIKKIYFSFFFSLYLKVRLIYIFVRYSRSIQFQEPTEKLNIMYFVTEKKNPKGIQLYETHFY